MEGGKAIFENVKGKLLLSKHGYAEYIKRNAGLDKAQAGIKIARKISITSDMQMTPHLWQKVKS